MVSIIVYLLVLMIIMGGWVGVGMCMNTAYIP